MILIYQTFLYPFNIHSLTVTCSLFLTYTLSSSQCSGKNVTKYLFVQSHLFWVYLFIFLESLLVDVTYVT